MQQQFNSNLEAGANPSDPLPLSLLNDFLYCSRRAAWKAIAGVRSANAHTLAGDLVHDHVDFPGFEHRAGTKLLRALPLVSDAHGLIGKADLVEVRERHARVIEAAPVEYKSGRKRKWDNDDVQLCAQALCLEEMFAIVVPEGAVFHAKSKSRRTVAFTPALRQATLHALAELRALIAANSLPPPVLKPQCDGCSLREICLPEVDPARALRASKQLFVVT